VDVQLLIISPIDKKQIDNIFVFYLFKFAISLKDRQSITYNLMEMLPDVFRREHTITCRMSNKVTE
jgi:hypothetical protein